MISSRPRVKIQLTKTDKIITLLGWLILTIMWVYTLITYLNLPDIIPTNFNLAGEVSSYGNRSSIFSLPIICLLIFIVLSVLNKFPYIFNYPVAITVESVSQQYRIRTKILRYLKLALSILFLIVIIFIIEKIK